MFSRLLVTSPVGIPIFEKGQKPTCYAFIPLVLSILCRGIYAMLLGTERRYCRGRAALSLRLCGGLFCNFLNRYFVSFEIDFKFIANTKSYSSDPAIRHWIFWRALPLIPAQVYQPERYL